MTVEMKAHCEVDHQIINCMENSGIVTQQIRFDHGLQGHYSKLIQTIAQ